MQNSEVGFRLRNLSETRSHLKLPLSAALYLAQFLTPMILSLGNLLFVGVNAAHLPYCIALLFAILLTLWSFAMIREDIADKHIVRQEA